MSTRNRGARPYLIMLCLVVATLALLPGSVYADSTPFLPRFSAIRSVASTIPSNGDLNPYGVAVVHRSVGRLHRGAVLVSNFNNGANLQGTGTTIVQIGPDGSQSLFAQIDAATLPGPCPGGVGLTTALVVLDQGWVIVGSLPTSDGTAATAQAGCLIVLDSRGRMVETFAGVLINGPWDMTAAQGGDEETDSRDGVTTLFVTNVLNGTVAASPRTVKHGTVVRIRLAVSDDQPPRELDRAIIGSDFPERTDPDALVIGPTGVALGPDGTLYVADSLANRIAAIPDALERQRSGGSGRTVSRDGALNDPLGLTLAPNGDILSANGNDGRVVETSPEGNQVALRVLDDTGTPPGAGTLFGLAVAPQRDGVYFVDDGSNTLNLLH